MARDAVNDGWNKSDHGGRKTGQTLVKLAEDAYRHGANEEAIRLVELAYARFDADYGECDEDIDH